MVDSPTPIEPPDPNLTNKQWADQALSHIKLTTVGYNTWLNKQEHGAYEDITQTQWYWVLYSLNKIQ